MKRNKKTESLRWRKKSKNSLQFPASRTCGMQRGFALRSDTLFGLLLINLGTPDAPTPSAVRRYLREFLSDPRVVDINPVGRALLLNLIILPFRPRRSAHAYQQIWTDEGSPLLVHSRSLTAGVQAVLGSGWHVELAMRYGNPSLPAALASLRSAGVKQIVVLPLFPQDAPSSSGTALARTMEVASKGWDVPTLTLVPGFYADAGFLDTFAAISAEALVTRPVEHVLYSFHGVPERHVKKSDAHGVCLAGDCCATLTARNQHCYRAQCFATARALANRMSPRAWSVGFQSRLGRLPWIGPSTDDELARLAAAGVKHLGVMCPAFVADCLETLEEIGLRAKDTFRALGGNDLVLIPSLNADPRWCRAVAALAQRSVGQRPNMNVPRDSGT